MKTFILKEKELNKLVDFIMSIWTINKPLLLEGEIGSGKTTFVKALAKKMGIKEVITSPTFTIMKIYNNLVHIDAYRIDNDLSEYEDYFLNKYLIVEWPKNIKFQSYIKVVITLDNNFKHRTYIVSWN